MSKKTYLIPEFGITVTVNKSNNGKNFGDIETELKKHLIGPAEYSLEFEGAINALESLILAHACAEIDVASQAYVEGLRKSLKIFTDYYVSGEGTTLSI